jgi:hypothetical protein
VRSTKARIAKLEGRNSKTPTVIRFIGFGGDRLLTPEEEAVLEAERERLIRETKTGFVYMRLTKEEAQKLSVMTKI